MLFKELTETSELCEVKLTMKLYSQTVFRHHFQGSAHLKYLFLLLLIFVSHEQLDLNSSLLILGM